MRLHLNTAWHSFLGIITSHEARDRSRGLLCAAHVANWLVSCHLVFLQIGKLSFSAGALELLSLSSRFPLKLLTSLMEMAEQPVFCLVYVADCLFTVYMEHTKVRRMIICWAQLFFCFFTSRCGCCSQKKIACVLCEDFPIYLQDYKLENVLFAC